MKITLKEFAANDFSKWSNPDLAIRINELIPADSVETKVTVNSALRKFIEQKLNIKLDEKESIKSAYNKLKTVEGWEVINEFDPTEAKVSTINPEVKDLAKQVWDVMSKIGVDGEDSLKVAKDYRINLSKHSGQYFNFRHRGYSYRDVYEIDIHPSYVNPGAVYASYERTRKGGRRVNEDHKDTFKDLNKFTIFFNQYFFSDLREIKEKFQKVESMYKSEYVPHFASSEDYFLDEYEGKPRIIAISTDGKKCIDGFRSYDAVKKYLSEFFKDEQFVVTPFSGPTAEDAIKGGRYISYVMLDGIEGYKSYIGGRKWNELIENSDSLKALAAAPTRYQITSKDSLGTGNINKVAKIAKYVAVFFDFDEESTRDTFGPSVFQHDFYSWSYYNKEYKKKVKNYTDAVKDFRPSLLEVNNVDGNYFCKLIDGPVPDFLATSCVGLSSKPKIDTKAEVDIEALNKVSEDLGKGDGFYVYTSTDGNGYVPVAGPFTRDQLNDYKSDAPYQMAIYSKVKHLKIKGTKTYPLHTNRHMLAGFFRFWKLLKLSYKDYQEMKEVPTSSKLLFDAMGLGRIGKTATDKSEVKYVIAWVSSKDYKSYKIVRQGKLMILDSEDTEILSRNPVLLFTDGDPKFDKRSFDYGKLRYVGLSMFKKTGLYEDGDALSDCNAERGSSIENGISDLWVAFNYLTKCIYRYYNDGDHAWRKGDYYHEYAVEGIKTITKFCNNKGIKCPSFKYDSEKDFFAAFDLCVQLIYRGA